MKDFQLNLFLFKAPIKRLDGKITKITLNFPVFNDFF